MTWDRDRFDRAYQHWDNASQRYVPAYRRARQQASPVWDRMVAAYTTAGILPGLRLLIVGCGFGWTIERLVDLGVDARGTDTSPWINSAKASEARADIRDRIRPIDVTSPAGRSLGLFDMVATELVVDSIPAGDLAGFFDTLETLLDPASPLGRVVHLVIPAPPADPDPTLELRRLDFGGWISQRGSHVWAAPSPDGRWIVRFPNGSDMLAGWKVGG